MIWILNKTINLFMVLFVKSCCLFWSNIPTVDAFIFLSFFFIADSNYMSQQIACWWQRCWTPGTKAWGTLVWESRQKAKQLLTEELAEDSGEEDDEPPAKKQRTNDHDDDNKDIDAMDFLLGTSYVTPTSSELDMYIQAPTPPTKSCPLEWWRQHQSTFPKMAKLALRYLSIPATSVPSEHVFSQAWNIINSKRSRLSPENVNALAFLNVNSKHIV